jgi:hypothetical protein
MFLYTWTASSRDGRDFRLELDIDNDREIAAVHLRIDGEAAATARTDGLAGLDAAAVATPMRVVSGIQATLDWHESSSPIPVESLRQSFDADRPEDKCDECVGLCALEWLACIADCWGNPDIAYAVRCTIALEGCKNACPCSDPDLSQFGEASSP